MDDSLLPPLTRVAVIGAGALGLTRASPSPSPGAQPQCRDDRADRPAPAPPFLAEIRQLIDAGVDRSQIVGYEARKEVGGTWCVSGGLVGREAAAVS